MQCEKQQQHVNESKLSDSSYLRDSISRGAGGSAEGNRQRGFMRTMIYEDNDLLCLVRIPSLIRMQRDGDESVSQ